jgi:hypothetical protein
MNSLLEVAVAQDLRRFRRFFARELLAKIITLILFLGVFAAVGYGIYALLDAGFQYIARDESFAPAVFLYVDELFAAVLFFLVAASSLITASFSLFSRRQQEWLMVSPRFTFVFWYHAGRIVLSSVWPLLLLLIPALCAFRVALDFHVGELLAAVIAVALLTGLTALGVLFLVMLVAKLLEKNGRLTPAGFIGWIAVVALLGAIGVIAWVHDDHVLSLLLGGTAFNLNAVSRDFAVSPSHAVALVLDRGVGSLGREWLALGWLGLGFLITLALTRWSATWYLPLWQRLQEGRGPARNLAARPYGLLGLLRSARTSQQALLAKELVFFSRDQQNLFWFGFLALLWLCESLLTRGSVQQASDASVQAGTLLPFQVLIALYFTSVLVLRFVFPSYSLEGSASWVLASAPVDLARVFYSKFAFFGVIMVLLGVLIFGASLQAFHLGIASSGLLILLIAVASLVSVGLGLLLGVLFPDFRLADPQALSTSLTGLGLTFVSLLYGAGAALVIHAYLASGSPRTILVFLVASVTVLVVALVLAPKAIRRMESGRTVS